jgi:hypothetical protein
MIPVHRSDSGTGSGNYANKNLESIENGHEQTQISHQKLTKSQTARTFKTTATRAKQSAPYKQFTL